MLKKYAVYGVVTGSKYIGEVYASSSEEAKEKAFEHDNCHSSLCHQCSCECEDPEIHEIHVDLREEGK
jgi:hypothetical protein